MTGFQSAALFLTATNLLAFLTYGYDKHQARVGGQRVPEATLLWLAVVGGIGAWTACKLFRHKTRKQPFRSWLIAAVALHLAIMAAATWWMLK